MMQPGKEIEGILAGLYAEQIARSPTDYLRYHSTEQAIASRVHSFIEYRDFLPAAGRILDWGCHHAPDSAMVRAHAGGNAISLTGCDFMAPGSFPAFWDYSGLDFVKLEHTCRLPFEDDAFDCIIAAAALEHTAQDYESLKELYRVLKTDGRLIITHLPNSLSYVEFAARHFRKTGFHRRLYSPAELSTLLKRTGFFPLKLKRHRLLPTNSFQKITKAISRAEPFLDRLWPINLFCGDIMSVAVKVASM